MSVYPLPLVVVRTVCARVHRTGRPDALSIYLKQSLLDSYHRKYAQDTRVFSQGILAERLDSSFESNVLIYNL